MAERKQGRVPRTMKILSTTDQKIVEITRKTFCDKQDVVDLAVAMFHEEWLRRPEVAMTKHQA